MEDVQVQADSKTNELLVKTNTTEACNENVRNEKSNELDKFKRRMIRAIARLLYTENKAEADIWDDLKNETGCDCELLWSRMRALTIKKLFRLFTAEDKINNITKIVQLSVTDWLLYDLVLVHEKVDVIGQELDNKEEPAFLRDLFNLVEEFNIENATEEELCEKWFEATAKYNNTGKRQCSPMLLQKRWYQLKELSRRNFYNFWFMYRGDSRKLERANEFKPSDLQLDIVKRYREIVTKPFLSWEVLIKERRVALPADFERLRLARNKISISENEPDLEVIEQQVETIDLEEINDSSDSVNKNTDNNEEFNDFNIDIVKIESLAEQDDDVSVLESVHIPLEQSDSGEINNSDVDVENTKSPDDNDLEIIESDSEQIMPKIASVTSTAYLESAENRPEKSHKEVIDIEHYDTQTQSVDAVNTILDQIVKKVVENKIITNLDEKNETASKENVLKLNKNREELSSNLIIDLDKEEIKKINIQDNFKISTNTRENCEQNSNIDFDDFSNNYNFIDDGIEFVDDGIEYMDEDYTQPCKAKPEIKSEIIEETNEEEPKIDLKLLLTPVVYTKKLDDMDVFRFIDYNTVKDDRVLQNAARESKPEDAKSIDMKKMFQEYNHDEPGNVESDDSDIIPDYDIAISSWLFRKPKVDNYNPIQLCKNPDFNTRLKRLAAAFYTSERNRLLLKQCKPLTVDLHKTFESRLINNTLYLKNTKKDLDINIPLNEMIATSYKTELPEIIQPSTHNEIAAEQQISIEQISETHTERNKVINLPDIDQIRRVNQRLLVAEVSPIQVSNPVNQSNIKPENNVSNSVDEPETPHMNSMATDEDIIKSPSNASECLFETDKVIAVSENENSKLTDAINVDNEQSETLPSNYTIMHNPTNYKRHNLNSLFKHPVPRYRTKTGTNKYMELSWVPKPQPKRTDAIDCLLAADTVERILSLCKDDYISSNPKVLKPKRKRKTGVQNKNISLNQIPAVRKKNTIKEKKNEKKKHTSKKSKCISTTTQTTNIKNVCCWSRQKIENFYKLNTGKHFCLHNQCVCCCKADLEAKLLAIEQERKRCDPIILSDDESIAITAGKKHHPISKVTIGTNTDYDKDFEDQFAANLNTFNDNSNQVFTPIISLPLGNFPQTESGCQTQTPNIVKKLLPPSTTDNKITGIKSTHNNKSKVPISLGKNKILLCSFKPTTAKTTVKKIKKYNQNSQSEQVLPEGCHLVLLPNRELALSINPGVELDANELSKLPSLIAAVQKQINFIPTSENNLDPYKVALNEETVIHLSDDENSSIKDNLEDNLIINDCNTSKSSPTPINLGSSNANIVTDVGGITNEENQIPNSDSNDLSSSKESCDIPGLVTTNNSITTNIDVILESSTNEINSKDNTSEVIDNSTNNTEDASGVNKKTILSDLMEMSGISTDDITISNNIGNCAGNDGSVSNNGSNATNDENISIIHPVLSQVDSSTSDLQREYINITRSVGIKSITNNIIIRAALLRCPELNVVSSFPELKFAYENGAQFFKMDVVNGIIVPINICIKQDLEEVRMLRRKGISKVPKSVIDLTEDSEIPAHPSNIQPIQQKMTTHTPNEIFDETAPDIDIPNKNNGAIKPIKMFKAIHPSILRYSGRSLLVRPIKKSTTVQNKIIGVTKHKRKQELYVQNIDLDEDNKLKSQNNPSKRIDSDPESDEEPLAKKAKRLKDNLETENKNNGPSLDVDSDMNSKRSATMDINIEVPPQLQPIVFEDNTGQSSDDDCILGV